LLYGKYSDLVGGEFWYGNDRRDALECRLAASTVHVYDKKVCYSEAFTSYNDLNMTPAQVKTRGDQIFAEGVNHYVFHVSVHQPDLSPDIISPWFGMPLHRKNAWFSEAKSWIDYVRRCQYLLQQGRYVADVAYFMGEDAPMMAGSREPAIPAGYAYDFVNADVIMNRMRMKDGRFTLPDGLSYKLLVLPPGKTMRPETLAKLKTLVEEGGAIYGSAPERSPSLENYPACDARVQGLAGSLWSGKDEDAGKGRVFTKGGLDDVLKTLACNPDFADGGGLLWIHRKTADGDIYFVTNQENSRKQVAPVFKVDSGLQPAFWNPIDGTVAPCGLFSAEGAGVRVPMTLEPAESRFVVFSRTRRAHVAALKPLRCFRTRNESRLPRGRTWRMTSRLPTRKSPVLVELICRRRRCFPMDGRRRIWRGWPGLLSRGLPSTSKSLARPIGKRAPCWTLDRLLIWCGWC
jgi:hypothetical protein